jgi:transcription termination factor NusB
MNKITSRKKSRKYLFQKLFSLAYNFTEKEDFDNAFLIDAYADNLDDNYLEEMEKIILNNQEKLIYVLKLYAPKFPVEKMDLTYVIPIFI